MWAGRIWGASTKWEPSLVMQDEEGKLGEAGPSGLSADGGRDARVPCAGSSLAQGSRRQGGGSGPWYSFRAAVLMMWLSGHSCASPEPLHTVSVSVTLPLCFYFLQIWATQPQCSLRWMASLEE